MKIWVWFWKLVLFVNKKKFQNKRRLITAPTLESLGTELVLIQTEWCFEKLEVDRIPSEIESRGKLLLFGDLHFTDFCWQPGKIGWWQQQYFHSKLYSIFGCCLGGLIWVTTTFYIQWKLKHSKYFLNFYSQFSTPTLEPSGSWFWRWLYIVTFDLRCVEPLVEYQRQPDPT